MGRDFFVGGGNALHHIGETEKQVDFRGDTAKQRSLEFTGGNVSTFPLPGGPWRMQREGATGASIQCLSCCLEAGRMASWS